VRWTVWAASRKGKSRGDRKRHANLSHARHGFIRQMMAGGALKYNIVLVEEKGLTM
jgi:hypothetical protein